LQKIYENFDYKMIENFAFIKSSQLEKEKITNLKDL